ncbi:MAG TPA: dihydroorotate dehydrogenase-like protein [bacterium]|nr:dihydroorotate dehydrogenase-like protein [bacterium]
MDLRTQYLGLALAHPLVASASPLWLELGNIRWLEDAGAAAVVLPSIFEEQIEAEVQEVERLVRAGADSTGEAQSYFPSSAAYRTGTDGYLDLIRRAREAVDMPVIASLNGVTASGWTRYAREVQQAGASAIELNVYFVPSDLSLAGAQVEQRYADVLGAVKRAVSIPVAMKLSPYFSAVGHTVRALDECGADGFVLFNRFYQPDIDLVELRLRRDLILSAPSEIRLPLLWLGVLAGQVRGSLAASTGVETADEVIKYLLVGADVVMTTSALLRHGVGYMQTLLDGLTNWLDARNIDAVSRIRGRMSRRALPDAAAFERANYITILQSDHHASGVTRG